MIGRLISYLWLLTSIAVLVAIWYSGVYYGRGNLQEALRTQDASDMAACRDAWLRWGHG